MAEICKILKQTGKSIEAKIYKLWQNHPSNAN